MRRHIEGDIQSGLRSIDALERSLGYLPLYESQETVKIMTDGLSVQEAAEIIIRQIREGK